MVGTKRAAAPAPANAEEAAEIDRRKQQREGRVLRLAREQLRFAAKPDGEAAKRARWFCLQVEGGFDFTVEKLLADCGVEVISPREKVTLNRRGKKIDCERPFFSGYLMTRFVPSPEAFDGLRKQRHVFGFVAGLTGYLMISDSEMKRFQRLDISRMPTDKSIVDGTEARIIDGPFAGNRCLVTAVKWRREGRAAVQIIYDGRPFEISDMPLAFLERL